MKSFTSLLLACGMFAYTSVSFKLGTPETFRPRVSTIVSHLEKHGMLTWDDHELGNGVKVAVYNLQDWHDAKDYLTGMGPYYAMPADLDFSNGTDTLDTIQPRAPLPSGSGFASFSGSSSFVVSSSAPAVGVPSSAPVASAPVASAPVASAPLSSLPFSMSAPAISSIPGLVSESAVPASGVPGSIGPAPPAQVSAAATSTPGASGTSSVPMADSTNHVTKWICNQPYNIPANLGESALAAIICQYIFPFFQKKVTGGQDTLVQRTMQLPPQANPADPGRFAQVLIHVEKNNIWPALKTILCSTLITQVVNNAYCWAYGKKFNVGTDSTPRRIPGATAGGQIYIYAADGVTATGFFEMDVVGQ